MALLREKTVMVGHALFMIVGTDAQGTFTNQWIFTDPVDPMDQVRRYIELYPYLARIEMTIDCPDKDSGRSIRIK